MGDTQAPHLPPQDWVAAGVTSARCCWPAVARESQHDCHAIAIGPLFRPLRRCADTLSQLRSSGVEFFTLSGLILSTLGPAASINGMGFAFPDYETVWKAMDPGPRNWPASCSR